MKPDNRIIKVAPTVSATPIDPAMPSQPMTRPRIAIGAAIDTQAMPTGW